MPSEIPAAQQPVKIMQVDVFRSPSELVVYFSDRTFAIYNVADLLAMAPERQPIVEGDVGV